QANEAVDVTFNGQSVGQPTVNSGGSWSLSFKVPSIAPGDYAVVAKGRAANDSATTNFTIKPGGATLAFSPTQAAPGTELTVTGGGIQPGETATSNFNGPLADTDTPQSNAMVTCT